MATRRMAGQRTYCNKNIWEGLLLFLHQIFSRWRIWTSTLSIISLFSLSHIRSPETGGRRLFPIYQDWNQKMRASRSWGSVSYFPVKIFRFGSVHENFVTLCIFSSWYFFKLSRSTGGWLAWKLKHRHTTLQCSTVKTYMLERNVSNSTGAQNMRRYLHETLS